MKKTIVRSKLIFFSFLFTKRKIKNELSQLNLRGNVKSLVETEFIVIEKSQEILKSEIKHKNIKLFNDRGNIIDESWYGNNNIFGGKMIQKYNDKGKEIEKEYYTSNGLVEEKHIYNYDNNKNIVVINKYRPNGEFNGRYVCKYNNKGNMIELNTINNEGKWKYKYTYKFNRQGKLIEHNTYSTRGSQEYINSLIIGIELIPKYLDRKNISKYDNKGNIIESYSYNFEGQLDSKSVWKSDENGNTIEWNSYDKDGSIEFKRTYKYTLGDNGNWIMKMEFENNIPRIITERDIEYF